MRAGINIPESGDCTEYEDIAGSQSLLCVGRGRRMFITKLL